MTDAIAQDLQSDEEAAILNSGLAFEDVALNGKINLPYLLACKQQLEEDIEHLEKMKRAA